MATGKGTLVKLTTNIRAETLSQLQDVGLIRTCDCEGQNQFIRLIFEKGLADITGYNRLFMNRSKAIDTEELKDTKN